jgi:hypothetical protein
VGLFCSELILGEKRLRKNLFHKIKKGEGNFCTKNTSTKKRYPKPRCGVRGVNKLLKSELRKEGKEEKQKQKWLI